MRWKAINPKQQAFKAGLLYFIGVFATGFAFGIIRTVLLEPIAGPMWAVVIELPFILGVSWLLCARAVAALQVSASMSDRVLMGLTAFICLIIAEYFLWTGLFGNSSFSFFSRYTTLVGLLGLVGQMAYAAFPVVQRKMTKP